MHFEEVSNSGKAAPQSQFAPPLQRPQQYLQEFQKQDNGASEEQRGEAGEGRGERVWDGQAEGEVADPQRDFPQQVVGGQLRVQHWSRCWELRPPPPPQSIQVLQGTRGEEQSPSLRSQLEFRVPPVQLAQSRSQKQEGEQKKGRMRFCQTLLLEAQEE